MTTTGIWAGIMERKARCGSRKYFGTFVLRFLLRLSLMFVLAQHVSAGQQVRSSWRGVVRNANGQRLSGVTVRLQVPGSSLAVQSGADGVFEFTDLEPGQYTVTAEGEGISAASESPVGITAGSRRTDFLRIGTGGSLTLEPATGEAVAEATGGEQLSSRQVSGLPLNKRDFSQLLLLASGTQTDTNGAANFTQQFTVNGQRGSATVFAMDGVDTTDPEMGGATFSNFNVDAIQEIKTNSGVLTADIGHGAAGFTEVVSKAGTDELHGSIFEFVRNAALDARNFFDRTSLAQPGRIPPFSRNEFGFTNGGPVRLPHLYDGRDRTYYFAQYQGFRQVLGTTQVLPVPTENERRGINTTAYPGDTLMVPVNPEIAAVLARYPMPNDPQGPYGERTYATSSKVRTVSDQISVRIDHRVSDKLQLFGRFNLNNVDGPLTNPAQTAIDSSFAVRFFDRQRNVGLSAIFTPSAFFTSESYLGFIRSTPNFPAQNHVEPGIFFADGLYEPFNLPAGTIMGAFGNLWQVRQNFAWLRDRHRWQAGFEARFNVDTTLFGVNPNGLYTFGGGAAYSPVAIRSLSGAHDIRAGDPLPDALSGFLTATPFSFAITAAPDLFPQGERMGDAAVRRQAYNLFFRDTWQISTRFALSYGLRYEVNTRISEANNVTSGIFFGDSPSATRLLINPQPPYGMDWKGWSPRLGFDWNIDGKAVLRAGASLTTLLPNLWQTNCVTAGLPFTVSLYGAATPGAPLPFHNSIPTIQLPGIYTPDGQLAFATGRSTDVAPNTEMDVFRFEREVAELSPDKQVRPVMVQGMAQNLVNGYVATTTVGLERSIRDVNVSVAYVSTAGVKLMRMEYPNAYTGADPAHARYTQFDSAGQVVGGYGPIIIISNGSHSSYHSLQASATKTSLRAGLGFQASYTLSKSLDDTSAVLGGLFSGSSGVVLQTTPQDLHNLRGEKGPSTFDVTHVFAFSLIQEVSLNRVPLLQSLGKRFTRGWQVLGMGSMTSGSPFNIYSGIQQTGQGTNGADRPDQIGVPELSTSRVVREDYFGLGEKNSSFFYIPIGVPGGTGPNQGRFGMLGRNTFRGPCFRNFDLSLIKNTAIGSGSNPERVVLQFRAEFFNIFNIVNFGLPANILLGPGFGQISRTAGTSRQIQFSLKILY